MFVKIQTFKSEFCTRNGYKKKVIEIVDAVLIVNFLFYINSKACSIIIKSQTF